MEMKYNIEETRNLLDYAKYVTSKEFKRNKNMRIYKCHCGYKVQKRYKILGLFPYWKTLAKEPTINKARKIFLYLAHVY